MARKGRREGKAPLSRTEWRLMNACWDLGKCTARQVHESSPDLASRDYQTIKTLLDRIAEKGYLSVEKVGPVCLYGPIVPRRAAVSEAIDDFVDVVLDRALDPLVAHLARAERLSDEDRQALESILARIGEGDESEQGGGDDGPG